MDKNRWKIRRISEILGTPRLDTKYLPPHVIISLKERIAKVEEVGALILYGSIVRGEASPKSDIDILIVPVKKEETETLKVQLMEILKGIEEEYKLENSFSLMIYTGEEDSYFLWEMIKDGVVLYSKPEMAIHSVQDIMPYALISYTYRGLKENDKKRIQRFLFESKKGASIDRNNKMEYIAPGVILLPLGKSKRVTQFFDASHLTYSLIKLWI